MDQPEPERTLLKDIFSAAKIRGIARHVSAVHPEFEAKRFLRIALAELDELSLMQRMRRLSVALRETLPADYRKAVSVLRALTPRLEGFAALLAPDFVGQYGLSHFAFSMDALAFFTGFGSSEFGVREYLRADPSRALEIMNRWARDERPDVRRLASEGSRPRLPWSFQIEPLVADPNLAFPILETLRADDSVYVRKSVANHLNDISKGHASWLLDRLETWPREDARTAWIIKHALRSLIKRGDKRALTLVGAGHAPEVRVRAFVATPSALQLGESIVLSGEVTSTSNTAQRLAIDYAVHYVKKSGASSAKVFKLKLLELPPRATFVIRHKQRIQDFTTRVHYPGRHEVELFINGERMARTFFELRA